MWKHISDELDKHDTSLRSLYGDGWSAPPLKQREFEVLTAAALLDGNGSLSEIHAVVAARVGAVRQFWILLTVKRLERRGLLTVRESDEPDALPRFQPTVDGDRALARARAEGKVFESVSQDVEDARPERETSS